MKVTIAHHNSRNTTVDGEALGVRAGYLEINVDPNTAALLIRDADGKPVAAFAPGVWNHAKRQPALVVGDEPDNSELDNEHPF